MLKINRYEVGKLKSNCYVVFDDIDNTAIIIDPGDDADYVIGQIAVLGVDIKSIIATHGHFDHNMAAYELKEAYKVPFMISEKDLFLIKKIPDSARYYLKIKYVKVPVPDSFLKEGNKIEIGTSYFKVVDLPGHTPGSIGLYNPVEKIYFPGDTIFKDGAIGRYDFSYSNKDKLFTSIKKILSLPENTIIYPGHGKRTCVRNEIAYHV